MSIIRILAENVACQIAAGEIVERPASVVRELLDNSLDAGADQIDIRIEEGGTKLVRVSDNGKGMDRDDILLCIERHATSKIRDLEDLLSIGTLGFRGEAIPSIASVSRMEITSRPDEQLSAHRVKIHGGRLVSMEEAGAPAGTSMEVRDLFYNTPARRKFLRTAKTESRHIVETVSRIALPFSGVHFRLVEGGRTLLLYAASRNELDRLAMLLGRRVAERMEKVEREISGIELRAYLAPAELSRSRGDRILTYINGRNIRDRFLTRAVMDAYGQRLMKGNFPQVVLNLELDPGLVDVNVHPTKQEVRFREGRAVYAAVVSILEQALARTGGALVKPAFPPAREPFQGTASEPVRHYGQEVPAFFGKEKPPPPVQTAFYESPFRVIGQLRNTYILCQTEDGLLMIDQHAAHERIVFERLKKDMSSSQSRTQPFLIPKSIDLTVDEARVLEENASALEGLGLELENFGGSTYVLRSIPSHLVDADSEKLVKELLAVLKEKAGNLRKGEPLDEVLAVMACHGAIRAGKPMSEREMVSLVDQLLGTELPTNCPHGRPVQKKISWGELERMFKRVV